MFLKSKSITNNLILYLIMISLVFLVGCNDNDISIDKDEEIFNIGINQLAEHPALDLVKDGFEDEINQMDININLDIKNAQGDISNTINISEKFVSDKKDLIFAIATPAAQSTKQVTTEIPIIFSAVTDPVEAGLIEDFNTPGVNITGTSDESPIEKQLNLFKKLDPSIKTIGIIYNTGEPNSQVQIDKAIQIAGNLDLNIETIGISNINDIPQATDSILSKVDGIYTITDNMVASAINVVAEKANAKQIITIGAEESHVKGGILMTDGISYYELGRQSAKMAKDILVNNKNINSYSCQTAENTHKVYNEKTLKTLNLNLNNKAFNEAKKIK